MAHTQIIFAGADEVGGAGIAVYFIGSNDGVKFSHQLTFLVSTGAKYWKVGKLLTIYTLFIMFIFVQQNI